MTKQSRKKKEEPVPDLSVSPGEETKERVRRHIRNRNDVITDDDIKNVKIDLSIPHAPGEEPLPIPDDKQRPKDEDKDHTYITPWDVLDE
jgi:hypothetical protein